ncbi:MAG: hypothetical protein HFI72_07500 [Peptococcaceae bacterium]|jgi:hypothetical protein|nr:hypothetical protein [Peptococcaceae bacterium]
MKDRLPTPGKENRVRIRQDDGQVVEGVLECADEATQSGSTYCKANVLPDDVCDYLTLDKKEAEPKDAFLSLEPAKIQFTNVTTTDRVKKDNIATPLSAARYELAAATVGNYALFAGGINSAYSRVNTLDIYNASLVRNSSKIIYDSCSGLCGVSSDNYALFAGGRGENDSNGHAVYIDTVNAFDASLTRTLAADLTKARENAAGASIGGYILFAGGESSTDIVEAYNANLTKVSVPSLSSKRRRASGGSNHNYALFSGSSTVDTYNSSLTRGVAEPLRIATDDKLPTATIGGYVLLCNGHTSTMNIDAYDGNLTKTLPTELSQARTRLTATAINNYALFGGGATYATVDAYNASLVRSMPTALSQARRDLAAAAVGKYGLFAGGSNGNSIFDTVDVYEAVVSEISIPPYSKYYFAGVTNGEEQTIKGKDIVSGVPLTGYIKKITELSGRITVN